MSDWKGKKGCKVGRLGLASCYGADECRVQMAFERGVNYLYLGYFRVAPSTTTNCLHRSPRLRIQGFGAGRSSGWRGHSRAAASNIWVRPAPFTYSVAYMLTIRSMARRHIAQNFSYRVNMMQFSCGR